MGLIANLLATEMLATYVTANQPSDERTVVLYYYTEDGRALCCPAYYKDGRWYGYCSNLDITESLTDKAIWSEMLLK